MQAIDNTGSTTFVLFDRVVSQFLGRSVQDLLDNMPNVCFFFYMIKKQLCLEQEQREYDYNV